MMSPNTTSAPAVTQPRFLAPLKFSNTFIHELPGDLVKTNHVRSVTNAAYSKVLPTPIPTPALISWSHEAAELLDLKEAPVTVEDTNEVAQFFSGNAILPGSEPWAQAYAGYQFGFFAGQLGDGRAISLGEVVNSMGDRWELQLKGAGKTPYSRFADGRAVLRSSIREFLCSEAMYHLGVPTSRALSLVGTNQLHVQREDIETVAVVLRLAPCWIRFGTFELQVMRKQFPLLKQLVDYTIKYHFPQYANTANAVHQMFREVIHRTATMIASWQAVGFAHGVMNTDNFSILGLTIDYGPFGFMEAFQRNFIPNHSDDEGRYSYARQPEIGRWNLEKLGEALSAFIPQDEARKLLQAYDTTFLEHYMSLMRSKLGLVSAHADDDRLLSSLLDLMESASVDWTIFWRQLSHLPVKESPAHALAKTAKAKLHAMFGIYSSRFEEWLTAYSARVRLPNEFETDFERHEAMCLANPKFVLRNYLAQNAITAAEKGDFSEVNRLLDVLRKPFEEQDEKNEAYATAPPDWAKHIVCSCSS